MRHVQQTDKRQATLNQIYSSVEHVRFGNVGTTSSFQTAIDGTSVSITNSRDGCGGATTIDVTVFWKNQPSERKFFRDPLGTDAVNWLNEKLAPTPPTAEDERGHTYASPSTAAAKVEAPARC